MRPLARHVLLLGCGQTLGFASSFYLPALLADPIARDTGLPLAWVFAAFSLALVVSAVVGPAAGRRIDQDGGRRLLMQSNLLFAAGLVALALAQGPVGVFAAWGLLGLAMGVGLYESAFAALVTLHGQGARAGITGITLLGGFASTVGWPLTALLEAQWGWRGACLGWAALHLLVGLPLHACLPRHASTRALASPHPAAPKVAGATPATNAPPAAGPAMGTRRTTLLLSAVFAIVLFGSTALATHLPRVLEQAGLGLTHAVAIASLVGPAQVAGRLLDFGLMRRLSPLRAAKLAAAAHPLGAVLLLVLGAPAALVFTLLHGGGNGVLTVAKGTLPLLYFGAAGYGERQGLMMLPARVAQALAPVAFGALMQMIGIGALLLTAALGVVAWWALAALGEPPAQELAPKHP